MPDAYAELTEHNDAGTVLALGAVGVFSKWVSSGLGDAGPTDLAVCSVVTDDITIGVNGGGVYALAGSITFGANRNALIECSVFVNGVECPNAGFHRTISNVNDQGTGPIEGLATLSPGDVLDLRFNSSVMNTTLTLYHVNLVVKAQVRDL